jgi:hypothetical protein
MSRCVALLSLLAISWSNLGLRPCVAVGPDDIEVAGDAGHHGHHGLASSVEPHHDHEPRTGSCRASSQTVTPKIELDPQEASASNQRSARAVLCSAADLVPDPPPPRQSV